MAAADERGSRPKQGETRLGFHNPGTHVGGYVNVEAGTGKVSCLQLQDTAGNTVYVFYDTSGNQRHSYSNPNDSATPNSVGTVVSANVAT